MSPARDHPRSRGVYGSSPRRTTGAPGSSPLARGLPGFHGRHVRQPGIIPARAGFTARSSTRLVGCRDHPRSRGVYRVSRRVLAAAAGSSPLARGLRARVRPDRRARGIIPARAGFTRRRRAPSSDRRDHPRSRGVYSESGTRSATCRGSSPLARGLRPAQHRAVARIGIIPARAGFTPPGTSPSCPARDHPRSRGVYLVRDCRRTPASGSSPLARGLQEHDPQRDLAAGIIPARAGFTSSARTSRARPSDHPRSRGVYDRASVRTE